jgi:DUF438 domain-containing protein
MTVHHDIKKLLDAEVNRAAAAIRDLVKEANESDNGHALVVFKYIAENITGQTNAEIAALKNGQRAQKAGQAAAEKVKAEMTAAQKAAPPEVTP